MSKTTDQKREYIKPSLKRLGAVGALTASGTKPGQENNGNTEGTMA